jgi:uncharacterized membrane protein
MGSTRSATLTCSICGQTRGAGQMIHGEVVHGGVLEMVQERHPEWDPRSIICVACLRRMQADYVQALIEKERGETTTLEEDVLRSLREHEILSRNVIAAFVESRSFGERVADRVALFGGSWNFLIAFALVMAGWIGVNSWMVLGRPFDPYPYILLNLVLSCLAAIQAPVIMMSQSRQEARDRLRSENDYRVNLTAELEIRHLHSKLDHLLTRNWQRLLEIQEIQTEILQDLARWQGKGPAPS